MNLITFIADAATQPSPPDWATGWGYILGIIMPAVLALLAWLAAREAKNVAHGAKSVAQDAQVDAAEARAGNEAAQQSITRISSRQNAFTDTVAKRLHEMPSPAAVPPPSATFPPDVRKDTP